MPVEWNYGYCEGNKEARVTFVNSGSTDVQTVISTHPPIKWETQIIAGETPPFNGAGQCCDVAYFVYFDSSTDGGNTWVLNSGSLLVTGKILGVVYLQSDNVSYSSSPKTPCIGNGNQLSRLKIQACNGTISYSTIATRGCLGRDRINRIVRRDGKPDNCAPASANQCKFTVSDASGIIYTQITDNCPSNVTANCGKKCPPNTCECRNGRRVCCYDSNGIPVLSFDA